MIDFLLESPSGDTQLNFYKNDKYILHFTAGFNNWGTLQDIYGNRIVIDKDGVTFCLEEPFCDDGSADALETILTEWLKTHKFIDASKSLETFDNIVVSCIINLGELKFEEKDKLQSIIDELIKAKTYMK